MQSVSLKRGGIRWSADELRAFRYARFVVEPTQAMTVECIQAEAIGPDLADSGGFECSDPRLNTIYDDSRDTLKWCMQDYYEDGIKRDRLLRIADMRVEALAGYYAFSDPGLARRCLLIMADLARPDGMLPGVGPEPSLTLIPDYCPCYVMALADYYRYTGDRDTVKLLYPTVRALMDWFQANSDKSGLFEKAHRPGWSGLGGYGRFYRKKDRVTAIEALYYRALTDAAELATVAGAPPDSRMDLDRAEDLGAAVNSSMFDDKQGGYVDCVTSSGPSSRVHKQTNALALTSGLVSPDRMARVLDGLTNTLVGPAGHYSLYELLRRRRVVPKRAHRRCARSDPKLSGAGCSIRATTFWEKYDPAWPGILLGCRSFLLSRQVVGSGLPAAELHSGDQTL